MARPASRILAYAALLLFAILVSGDPRVSAPGSSVRAAGVEVFTDTVPLKVYSGIPTHLGIADANPTNGVRGYCVRVANEGHKSIGPDNGFTVAGGVVVSSDFFNNGSATTTDDIYCVVAQATPNVTTLPRPKMTVQWTYNDGGATTIALDITVVTVELKGTDGFVLGAASICTKGWDDTFLTGFTQNNPPVAPNVPDKVVVADWSTTPFGPPTRIGMVRNGVEWCVNITSPTPLMNISATFKFWALYNLTTELDDRLITVTQANVVKITIPTKPELRHVTQTTGQQVNTRIANANVVGATHTACVVPSVLQDSLLPANVIFTDLDDARSVDLVVFKNDGLRVPGLPADTSCFSWTSRTSGITYVSTVFTASTFNPTNTSGGPLTEVVVWDTNGDGNNTGQGPGGRLEKRWDTIDHTILSGSSYLNGEIFELRMPIQFNVADGRFLGEVALNEWVLGIRKGVPGQPGEPIDGVPVVVTIVSDCGYFGVGPGQPTVLNGITQDGRIELRVNIQNDGGCGPGSVIRITAQASYPAGVTGYPQPAIERLSIILEFQANETAPIVVWAGTTVLLPYGFSGQGCPQNTVHWSRGEKQKGAFIGAGSHGGSAETTLVSCNTSMFYESEDPGEVDIVVQVTGLPYSKIHIPIFFIAFEDLKLVVSDSPLTVSERGDLDATVRGWFVGNNPSGRPAEKKGETALPKDRWVLPDDWQRLKGPEDFRPTWPSTLSMPPARVTYFMVNEGVRNSYQTGVKSGSSGFFLLDGGDEIALNVHPDTLVPSVLGRLDRPRIISEITDQDGVTQVDIYGDLNLTYEGCALNIPTGNPHCKPGDVAGHAAYFARVEYLEARNRGKFPPLVSNTVAMTFIWKGYKEVTWENGPTDTFKYVVAHLKDRDGFCDAIGLHNTLGVQVEFQIDSGDGIITAAADAPYRISTLSKDFAITTTFDTVDNNGNPINVTLVKKTIDDDECQAWIRISNSLGRPVNVLVTFSAPPAPVPGKVRITSLVCGPGGFAILTNVGDNDVSLAGFGLRSLGTGTINPEEHLDLIGLLVPGQSIKVEGTLGAGWIFGAADTIFEIGGLDYARLIWEEVTIDLVGCDGAEVHPPTPTLPFDGEGKIVLDIIVPFTETQGITLQAGWNLVAIGAPGIAIDKAALANIDQVEAIYTYDAATETWLRYFPNSAGNTMDRLEGGRAYWVLAKASFTLRVPR